MYQKENQSIKLDKPNMLDWSDILCTHAVGIKEVSSLKNTVLYINWCVIYHGPIVHAGVESVFTMLYH